MGVFEGVFPEAFGGADAAQHRSLDRGRRRQHRAHSRAERLGIERLAGHARQAAQHDRAVAGHYGDRGLVQGQDLTGLAPVLPGPLKLADRHELFAQQQLGQAERVAAGAEIQRPNRPAKLSRRSPEVQDSEMGRTFGAPVPAARAAQRRGLQPPGGEIGQQLTEGFLARLVAAKVEAERRLVRRHRKAAGLEHAARIDRRKHLVPRHGVLVRAFEDRPGRRVQPPAFGQRTVVEIDRHHPRGGQGVGAQHREVRHAEEIVGSAGRQFRPGRRPQKDVALLLRPGDDLRRRGHHPRHLPARLQERLRAADEKRAIPNKVGVWSRHVEPPKVRPFWPTRISCDRRAYLATY